MGQNYSKGRRKKKREKVKDKKGKERNDKMETKLYVRRGKVEGKEGIWEERGKVVSYI